MEIKKIVEDLINTFIKAGELSLYLRENGLKKSQYEYIQFCDEDEHFTDYQNDKVKSGKWSQRHTCNKTDGTTGIKYNISVVIYFLSHMHILLVDESNCIAVALVLLESIITLPVNVCNK